MMSFPLVNVLLSLFVVSHLRPTEAVVAETIRQVRRFLLWQPYDEEGSGDVVVDVASDGLIALLTHRMNLFTVSSGIHVSHFI